MINKTQFVKNTSSLFENSETIQLPQKKGVSIKVKIIRNRFAYTRLDGNIESYNIYTN